MSDRDGGAAFTPGPWQFDGVCQIVEAERPHMRVAFLPSDHAEYASSVPNGHLLAAAPELLSVLERYMAAYPAFRIKPVGEPGSPKRVEQENLMALEDAARSAIAAARTSQGGEG